MAVPIKTAQGTWRIQIEKHGLRKSKTFATKEAADRWSSFELSRMDRQWALSHACVNQALGTSLPARVLEALRDARYTHKEIVDVAIPIGGNCGVYFLLKDAVVVYVGQSIDLFNRIGRHAREGEKIFDAFTYILCEPSELDKMEETYITALVPKYNMRFGGRQTSRRKLHAYSTSDE